MVGVAGGVGSVSACDSELETQPAADVKVILYDPAGRFVTEAGNVTPFMEPDELPLQLIVPEPDPFNSIDPVDDPHEVGLITVPVETTGVGFTVITAADDVAEQPLPLVNVTA